MRTLGKRSNFLGLEKQYSGYDSSRIVILSAPLEKTVSYGKGTANGPKKILDASHYVEFYDEEINREICFEKGIATLPQLELNSLNIKSAIDKIEKNVTKHLDNDKFVVTLGGEHSLSLAPIKAHSKCYNNLSILQIDAHSDLRDSYEGSKYSHASVMHRVLEFNKNIVQVGIRAQCMEEAKLIKDNKINTFYMRDIRTGKYGTVWQKEVLKKLKKNVYITFDVDGLDPSIIPATGTPEPGGLLWDETMDLLKLVGERRNIVGFDVVELAPLKNSTYSDFATAKLVYKLLGFAHLNGR